MLDSLAWAHSLKSKPPREFSREQLERWIADDEAGYRRFRAGQ